MRIYLIFLFIFGLNLFSNKLQAQEPQIPNHYLESTANLQEVTSPNVYSFLKYIDNKVEHYTGTTSTSVDLFNLKQGLINYPISLSYNAAGIKVNEQASIVGLGWNINLGGVITEQINGKHDSYNYEYSDLADLLPPVDVDVWTQTNPTVEDLTFYLNLKDGYNNPDVFSFNFMGLSGQFIIDYRTNTFRFLDGNKNNLKVEPIASDYFSGTSNGYFNGWILTDAMGIKYYFDVVQMMYAAGDPGNPSSVSYHISKIIYPDGNYLLFNYERGDTPVKKFSGYNETMFEFFTDLPPQNDPSNYLPLKDIYSDNYFNPKKTVNISEYYAQNLTSIESSSLIISLTYGVRDDIEGEEKLEVLTVTDKNSTNERVFTFNYSYFDSNNVGVSCLDDYPSQWTTTNHLKRLKLNSVFEGDKEYSFEYYGDNLLPKIGSFAQDHWGYYNGRNNYHLVPNYEYFSEEALSKLGATQVPDTIFLRGVNWAARRGAALDDAQKGSLKKIIFPTKGSKEFIYGLHEFSNYEIPPKYFEDESYGVTELVDLKVEANRSYQEIWFKNDDFPGTKLNVNIQGYKGGYQPSSTLTEEEIKENRLNALKNARILLLQRTPAGSVGIIKTILFEDLELVYHFDDILSEHLQISEVIDLNDYNPDYEYRFAINLGVQDHEQDGMSHTTNIELIAKTPRVQIYSGVGVGGGLRIEEIINKDESDNITHKQSYTYLGGILHNPPRFLTSEKILTKMYRQNTGLYNCKECLTGDLGHDEIELFTLSANSSLSLNSNYTVGYNNVQVKNVDVEKTYNYNGYRQYDFINEEEYFIENNVPVYLRMDNGLLKEEEVYQGVSKGISLLKKTTYGWVELRNELRSEKYFGVVAKDLWNGANNFFCEGAHPYLGCPARGDNKSSFAGRVKAGVFNIKSELWVLEAKTETTFENGQELSVNYNYRYNDIGQLVESTMSNYNSSLVRSSTAVYPYDMQAPLYTAMVNANYLNYPVETFKFNNDVQVQSLIIDYQASSFQIDDENFTGYYPYKFTQNSSEIASDSHITDLEYDKGQLLELSSNGNNIAFIYDEHNRKIAQIKSASQEKVAFTSFEQSLNEGNWNFGDHMSANGRTGNKAYDSNIAITSNSLPSDNYIVGFWAKAKSSSGTVSINGNSVTISSSWKYYELNINSSLITVNPSNVYLDELRLYPKGSEMTSIIYSSLYGISSITDLNGKISEFEYDEMGRLVTKKDHKGNILEAFEYNYVND